MMDKRWLSTRRALLGGLGAAGAFALLPRRQAVAQAGIPKRFIVVHVPEGMWSDAARPAVGAASLGPIFGPLDPFRTRLTALDGLEIRSRDHGPGGDGHHRGVPHMLTCTEMADPGNAGGPSIDQKIAALIGSDTKFRSLQFAVRIVYGDTNAALIWGAARERLPAMQDPWEAYDRIFGDFMATEPTMPRVDLRRSALDHAVGEIAALSPKLAASDRERLESYHTSLRDIERRLDSIPAPGTCVQPVLGNEMDARAESLYPEMGKLQMDLMVAALRCDVTRVASLQWGNSNDQCSYPWLGVNALGHDLAHSDQSDKKQIVYNWYAKQFAYLLTELDAVKEGAGTMLDNTVVLWASEFGDSNGHKGEDLLWLLMGNAGGYLKQGQVMQLNNRSVSDLHATIGNAFGIPDRTFGNPAYSDGPIDGLVA